LITPKVGMTFQCEDSAYNMYNVYAHKVGCTIRKSMTRYRSDKSLFEKYIVYSSKDIDKLSHQRTQQDQAALLIFNLMSTERGFGWCKKLLMITIIILLVLIRQKKLEVSMTCVTEADKKLIAQIREARMRPSQVFEFMKQFYGGADKVPFSRTDCNNEIGCERKKYLESNDAHTLCNYLKNK
jgi:hypothetical protein